ncbi:hypothetical protein LKACC16343_02372 [Companilactobacillus bobalius]|uniref:Uncharacterized protein n=2 Tax=Companilactobacillus bobalius TaxID=2801451 RepID=A0A202F8D2_9LACO|nr:hypothetical protein LKACC16343_02372 [Companilactobacillus bobalius]
MKGEHRMMKKIMHYLSQGMYLFAVMILIDIIVEQSKYTILSSMSYYVTCLVLIILIIISVPEEGSIHKKFKTPGIYILEVAIFMAVIIQQNVYSLLPHMFYFIIYPVLLTLIVTSLPEGVLYKKFQHK